MRWSAIIFLPVVLLSVPLAYGQFYGAVQDNSHASATSNAFPKVAYSDDKKYEVDMTWEPHQMLTDKKIIFIFQFYDYKTGELVPMVDYQFVISQGGKELTRISGTTSQAGDYKYFAFDRAGPVAIILENIGDTDASVSFNADVSRNPNPGQGISIVQPPANISNKERSIFPIMEDVFVGVLITLLLWFAREPILRRLNLK